MTSLVGTPAGRTRAARPRTAGRAALLRVLLPFSLLAVLALAWELAARTGAVAPNLLPAPSRILEQAFLHGDVLWSHTFPTLTATVVGFSSAVVVAFLLATALDFSGILRLSVLPLLVVSQTLPIVALAPLVVLWFGFGLLPKVLLVALVTFFPMTIAFLQGFASTDADATRLLRSLGAGRMREFVTLRLPSAVPSFFAGLRISITYAVVGAIFAEYAGATSGLGVFMQSSKSAFRTDLVLSAVLVCSVLTLLLYGLVLVIEHLSTPWLRVSRGAGR
ncbi:ABC transporter permease [Microbacterium sp. 18062]|uniref:ABC transporter permease n=1 Tax=Microbacterium sp. 18062 TaxID=2681410 RepID=UPI00135A27C1|nr:ABC transporter permease [Microbacterium sp. 18062]